MCPSNDFYDSSGAPSTGSSLSSSVVRAEFDAVEEGFKKIAPLTGHGSEIVFNNPGGSAQESKTISEAMALLGAEAEANKDASGGYAGLTLFKLNLRNAANTITSFFTNANTGARTYTLQDRDGTIADLADVALKADALDVTAGLALKADLNSPSFTGEPSAPTPANTDDTTKLATTGFVRNVFEASLGRPGYLRTVEGIVFQWGIETSNAVAGQPTAVTFPLAFSAGIYALALNRSSISTVDGGAWASAETPNGFDLRCSLSSQPVRWLAVGYIIPA